ncbi:hypothetical protein NIES2109_04950 [Nostoc sp. HK-01]|nr:hypothetical protein NIES2109_04950 [Nostoc sp. HK-01]
MLHPIFLSELLSDLCDQRLELIFTGAELAIICDFYAE